MTSGKYVIISGFDIHDNNRGTAALSLGAISFLANNHALTPETTIVVVHYVKRFWRKCYRDYDEVVNIDGANWTVRHIHTFAVGSGNMYPAPALDKIMKETAYVAALNGGDGFTDIYGEKTFNSRLAEILAAFRHDVPVIFLPQTIGPFADDAIRKRAFGILKKTSCVYVRDHSYDRELVEAGIDLKHTDDLSVYMSPEKYDLKLRHPSIGINVSGLAYYNSFRALSGRFEGYPEGIKRLVDNILEESQATVYLIPHSYNAETPEPDNDDLAALRHLYSVLPDKGRVVPVDAMLTAPQLKYLISQMDCFVGSRMHACYAAIYCGVPVVGLAYSKKFYGAFAEYNLTDSVVDIINNRSWAEECMVLLRRYMPTSDEVYNN